MYLGMHKMEKKVNKNRITNKNKNKIKHLSSYENKNTSLPSKYEPKLHLSSSTFAAAGFE